MPKTPPVDNLWKTILDMFFPKKCIGCRKINQTFLCDICKQKIQEIDFLFCPACQQGSFDGFTHSFCQYKTHLDRIVVPFKYQGIIKEMIRQFKYCGIKGLSDTFADLMIEFCLGQKIDLQQLSRQGFILVPIPLHQTRKKERGFNQAEKLAESLSEKLNLQSKLQLLFRTRDTPSQISLSKKDRRENIKAAFSINPEFENFIKNKNFILVDDVFTTGATLNECARMLKRSGAREIWGLTVAKD